MKKAFYLLILLVISTGSFAQVFNTSSTLKAGQFAVGIEPGVYINGGTDFNLFLHGGAGITSGVDLALKLGILGNAVYLGGDVEFMLSKRFSLAAGAHSYGTFGLDFTGLLTFPLGRSADLYTGLDADLNFPDGDVQVPLWIPLGLEIPMRNNLLFFFETEINLTSAGSHFIGGGVNFLF
jgi:hypothetical protein